LWGINFVRIYFGIFSTEAQFKIFPLLVSLIEWKNQTTCGAAIPVAPAKEDWNTMLLAYDLQWLIKPVALAGC